MSSDVMWRGDEETHEARRAARSTHMLRRGAERGRGEAAERERRERRCDHEVSGNGQARESEFAASVHSRASARRSPNLGLGLVNYLFALL